MSQYRSEPSPVYQQRRSGFPSAGAYLIGSVFLGICILISAIIMSSSLKALGKAVDDKTFASTYTSPDKLTVKTETAKKYLSDAEAAEYLNISKKAVTDAISDNKITDYIITDDGYSISVEALDEYFENEAYQIQIKKKSDTKKSGD
ncbi:MAG: helix-turn-helix domain-containing protein [Oscillospiraceae bacterium]|nr:helix-turn-helix domain-containing protein [Oscillospiraceae bacterium]